MPLAASRKGEKIDFKGDSDKGLNPHKSNGSVRVLINQTAPLERSLLGFKMAGGNPPLVCLILIFLCKIYTSNAQVLSPPYFNLAQGRNITASATCGEDVPNAELFCRLTGATGRGAESRELIQGQLCDYCIPEISDQNHGPEYAIDGSQRWWQSPPLSRGVQYNEVNLTINLGQVCLTSFTIFN